MLELDAALARLHAVARLPRSMEIVPLTQALGRVLAADLVAKLDVPGFDNSAMDGYALHVADFADLPASYVLTGRIAAGESGDALAEGAAARIFTGAPVPAGANAVAMQEECSAEDGHVSVRAKLKPGLNIRRRGEDIAAGSVVLPAGSRMTPQAMALAASIGAAELCVFAPLRVALLSTGSELVEPGQPLAPAQIYNSNRYALRGLLQTLGCAVTDLGIVPDNLQATRTALAEAAALHDVVMTTGGVSVGEEDHVKTVLQQLGQLDLWQVNIKPGKPFALGKIGAADFIGLPGNPVSCFITFLLLARPFLLRRQGQSCIESGGLLLPAGFEWPKADKRRNFLRARLSPTGQVELFPQQGSAVMTSLVWAEGLVDIAPGETVVAGNSVRFLPLANLM